VSKVVFLRVMQVMHSDLKTKNVLLTKDHVTAKIADVGLSQFLDHQTDQPNIIACEQWLQLAVQMPDKWLQARPFTVLLSTWRLANMDVLTAVLLAVQGHCE
jgi:serine/threonine protein kinase